MDFPNFPTIFLCAAYLFGNAVRNYAAENSFTN